MHDLRQKLHSFISACQVRAGDRSRMRQTQLLCKSGHPGGLVGHQIWLEPGEGLRQNSLQGATQPRGHSSLRQSLHNRESESLRLLQPDQYGQEQKPEGGAL